MKITILGFGEIIEGGWTNPQWMAKTLSDKGYVVDYFNPPAYRKIQFRDFRRFFLRLKNNSINNNKNRFLSHNTFYPFKILGSLFNKRLYKNLKSADVIFVFQPNWLKCIDLKNFSKNIIYFKTDDYLSVSTNKVAMQKLEDALINVASSICVTSKNLMLPNSKSYYTPNCVPESLLDSINPRCRSSNDERPLRACFVGAIWDEKVDIKMLIHFINHSPEIEFDFAGKILSENFKNFLKKPPRNFKYHGVLSFKDAQTIISNSDVGLMPFLINKYTDSMFSMKFFEYIASGIPVLTTDIKMLDEISVFNKYIIISNSFSNNDIKKIHNMNLNFSETRKYLYEFTYESRINKMIKLGIL